ncbi:hypothetical protein R3P38DRAFT_3206899 [Favolaschia claudopus]|uniref:Uncharacterized protein n=1 Tax=Favolaschia claudopus TaxID=2862362 RepID=A0AAW0AK28_9AGAR
MAHRKPSNASSSPTGDAYVGCSVAEEEDRQSHRSNRRDSSDCDARTGDGTLLVLLHVHIIPHSVIVIANDIPDNPGLQPTPIHTSG